MTARTNKADETAVIFDCQGAELIGVLHHAQEEGSIGLLTVVAGGPQYRGGCGRQLVELGRRLSSEGIPVFRFDYRGMGDSEGKFTGFRFIAKDIEAAINEFKRNVPSLRRIILWGGCDAASAVLMHAYRFDDVVGIIAANPFVRSEKISSRTRLKHYVDKGREHSFWRKISAFRQGVMNGTEQSASKTSSTAKPAENQLSLNGDSAVLVNHIDEMLTGLSQFKGRVLFLMSGRTLISKEFDDLVASSEEWQKAYQSSNCERCEIPEADQTFSTRGSRDAMLDKVSAWANRMAFTTTN